MKKTVPETPPITVWLVEDFAPFRNTVSKLLNSTPGLSCTHLFATGEDALRSLGTQTKPGVILLDVGLPGMNGIEFLMKVRDAAPDTRVVILTAFEDEEKLFRAGARRNKLVGLWAAGLLGKSGADAEAYATGVISVAIKENGLEAAQFQVALKQVEALQSIASGDGKQTILVPANALEAFGDAFKMLRGRS